MRALSLLSLLSLLLIGCQDYDNVQACEDWAVESGCREFYLQVYSHSIDCSGFEEYECDVSEVFDCWDEYYPCPRSTGVPSFAISYCEEFLICDPP